MNKVLFAKGARYVEEVVKANVEFVFGYGDVEEFGSSDAACLMNDIVKDLAGVSLKELKELDDFNPVELGLIEVAIDNAINDLDK